MVNHAYSQTLAFPSAEGYGKYASGGRGGEVVEVTNLLDYDPATEDPIEGSFRWAFTQAMEALVNKWGVTYYEPLPLTVVFKVGGVIELKADFSLNRDNVTIAGQTALGQGICFKDYTVKFGGNENVIVRFLSFRPGDETGEEVSAARFENGGTFIFDHCSMSWGIEETTHFSSANDYTVQWCIVSEGLYNSIHKKGARGYAAQWGGSYSTYHHNLLAHNYNRSPRINGANDVDIEALVDYRNNLNFNWGKSNACYGGEWESYLIGFAHTNFVNNYYKPGNATSSTLYFAQPSYERSTGLAVGYGQWYFDGNVMEGDDSKTADNWSAVDGSQVGGVENVKSTTMFVKTDGTVEDYDNYTESADDAYLSIIAGAGVTVPSRNGIDERIIQEVKGEISIYRSEYVANDVTTPILGETNGIIDSQWNTKPLDADESWDPWYSYYTTVSSDNAPVDTDLDGIPDDWENANGLNSSDPADAKTITNSGFSALEVYLNDLAGETIELSFPTAISTNTEDKIVIFTDNNNLYVNTDLVIKEIDIIDMNGKVVMSKSNLNGQSVNISFLTKGIYVAKANINGEIITHKFLKDN